MQKWWLLIYIILATNIFEGLHAQELTTSTSTVTTPATPSRTTITSLVEVSIGPNTTLTTTKRIGGTPESSSQSSTLATLSSSASDIQSSNTSLTLSPSPNLGSTLLTRTETSTTSTTSSLTMPPTGNLTEVLMHQGLTISDVSSIIVAAYAVIQGCAIGLWVWWWGKRKPFLHQPEEDAAWWIHPIYKFRRLLPYADQHTPRRTQPRVVALGARSPLLRTRPQISSPMPIQQNRPRRPLSLTESLMEDMRTSPQPRANPNRDGAFQVDHTESTENRRSLSPKALQVAKSTSPSNSGLSNTEFQPSKPIPIPKSARSSTSNYSTFSPAGLPPKPVYLPYSKPDFPLSGRAGQRTAPFADEDEDNEELKRLRREESLMMLEQNSAVRAMETVDEADDEGTSQSSYDFAEARARKVLANKRAREEFA